MSQTASLLHLGLECKRVKTWIIIKLDNRLVMNNFFENENYIIHKVIHKEFK
jgi:hypothetical protein